MLSLAIHIKPKLLLFKFHVIFCGSLFFFMVGAVLLLDNVNDASCAVFPLVYFCFS
jgi:hypothetical protein